MSKKSWIALALCLAITTPALAQKIPFNFIKQWEIMPGESLASLVDRNTIEVVGSDLTRLDEGLVVNVVYLQNKGIPRALYRCVEYTREWQMETIQTQCFVAIKPESTR